MNTKNLCMGCMQELPQEIIDGWTPEKACVCPFCGFDQIAYVRKLDADEKSVMETNRRTMYSGTTAALELPQRPLPPGTVIGGSYIIGKKLGAGGFGISYIGFDINFERKVAIKEFYPRGFADRDITGTGLIPRQGKRGAYFEEQKELFAHEGKVLAQFDEPGIVRVLSFCREFNTAYIIMEYLEGQTLNLYIKEKGGYLPAAEALELVRPVVKSLARLHEKGIVHRDISSDNIMLTAGGPKLIDFGAALGQGEHAEGPPIGKKGYAPIEQLSRNGSPGTYSDVYALCAMIYQMITSQKPERSMDRAKKLEAANGSYEGQVSSDIYSISAYQVYIPPVQEAVIMQGLAIDYKQRIKNAGDLYYLLYVYGADAASTVEGMQKKVRESSTDVILQKMKNEHVRAKSRTWVMIATVAVMILGCLIIAVWQTSKDKPVVITDNENGAAADKDNDDGASADDLIEYRDMLYASVNSDRYEAGNAAATVNEDYEKAADYAVNQCVNAACSGETEWSSLMTSAAEEGMSAYGIAYSGESAAGWTIRTYGSNMTIESVKNDLYEYIKELNAGVDNAIDLLNCSQIGISVGIHSDGTYFWMVIFS